MILIPEAASVVHQEVDGRVKKVLAALMALTLLLTACSGKTGMAQASVGVGRKLTSENNSW